MVVGHYGCGGVKAALEKDRVGLVDIWLRHVRDVHASTRRPSTRCRPASAMTASANSACFEQAANVCSTFVVQDAWARGQKLTVHAWIYGLQDGLMRDLGFTVSTPDAIDAALYAGFESAGRAERRAPEYLNFTQGRIKENAMSDPVVIVSAARTPMGAFQGVFGSLTAANLGATAIKAAVERAGLTPSWSTKYRWDVCSRPGKARRWRARRPCRRAAAVGRLRDHP